MRVLVLAFGLGAVGTTVAAMRELPEKAPPVEVSAAAPEAERIPDRVTIEREQRSLVPPPTVPSEPAPLEVEPSEPAPPPLGFGPIELGGLSDEEPLDSPHERANARKRLLAAQLRRQRGRGCADPNDPLAGLDDVCPSDEPAVVETVVVEPEPAEPVVEPEPAEPEVGPEPVEPVVEREPELEEHHAQQRPVPPRPPRVMVLEELVEE